MIRRTLFAVNKRSITMVPTRTMSNNTQPSTSHHGMKKEDFDELPDKNLETDTDRWSDPNNPTPEQERKLSGEAIRYNVGTPESSVDLNLEWKGFTKPQEEEDLKKAHKRE